MTRRTVVANTVIAGAAAALAIGGGSLWPRPAAARRETFVDRADLTGLFAEAGVTGTFALFDGASDTFTVVDRARAAEPQVPQSTFKIVNALIALETGAVADETEVIPYRGGPQPFPAWERDMSMAEALPISNVPIFQEIARRVGLDRYRTWLDRLDYGTGDIGDVVTRFWLDGPLTISVLEQAVWLDRLARRELPASRKAQDTVARIARLEARDGRALHGKTGWQRAGAPIPEGGSQLGWWVGWIEAGPADSRGFALAIDIRRADDGKARVPLGRALLAKLGVWPAP